MGISKGELRGGVLQRKITQAEANWHEKGRNQARQHQKSESKPGYPKSKERKAMLESRSPCVPTKKPKKKRVPVRTNRNSIEHEIECPRCKGCRICSVRKLTKKLPPDISVTRRGKKKKQREKRKKKKKNQKTRLKTKCTTNLRKKKKKKNKRKKGRKK